MRFGSELSLDNAARAVANRSLSIRRDPLRAMMTVTVELPLCSGELLEKALDRARDEAVLHAPELVESSWSMQQADAFVNIVGDYLSGTNRESSGVSDNYLVNVHVDQSALVGNPGRSALPVESVKRLCCDAHAIVVTEDEKGEPLNIGRKSRTVPTAIKRALKARDGCCAFPGCRNSRFVDAHHIQHWSAGGETSLDNLMLLCTQHHTLVHEGGFGIEKDYQNRWFFRRPDSRVIPASGYCAEDMQDEEVSESINYPSAEGLLSGLDNFVKERPPPSYFH